MYFDNIKPFKSIYWVLFLVMGFFIIKPDLNAQTTKPGDIEEVLEAYLDLGKALGKGEEKKSKKGAQHLAKVISQENFGPLFPEIPARLMLADSNTMLREIYAEISQQLRILLSKSEDFEMDVFVIFCQSLFQNKGAIWLSEEKPNPKKRFNPYLGEEGPFCGKWIETLKPIEK
jgi:hypothetical protein